MLVLNRRVGETIVIGENIRITVMSSERGQVKIGVQAPKDIPVHRQEVAERISQGVPLVKTGRPPTNSEVMHAALSEIIRATRAYLPGNGISAEELITRVIKATDTPEIIAVLGDVA